MTELFDTVLQRSAASCPVILAVLLARMLILRLPKGYRCALWLAVLFRLLCPAPVQSIFSLSAAAEAAVHMLQSSFDTSAVPEAGQDTGQTLAEMTELDKSGHRTNIEAGVSVFWENTESEAVYAYAWGSSLLICWLAGMTVLGGYSLIRFLHLLHRLRIAKAARVHFSFLSVRVFRVKKLETAFVLGIFRPRIYLPFGLDLKTERYMLAHEMVHVRRGDPLWRMLGFTALILHWFNPLVWTAWVLSGRDMEMSCDEAVLRKLGMKAKKGYSAALLSAAAGKSILPGRPPAFGKGDIPMRIKNVLHYKKLSAKAAVTAALAVSAFCVFLAADAPESHETAGLDSRSWKADLTHDGKLETIRFDLNALWQEGLADFTVESDGVLLYADTVAVSHAGWRTYALYQDEDGAYLLQYHPYAGQGSGSYSYELFCFDLSGRHVQKRGSVNFSTGMPYAAPDNDIDELTDFTDAVNDLWEQSVLLVSTDRRVLQNLYDVQGSRVQEREYFYTAPDTPKEPLHYVEQMGWTEMILDGRGKQTDDLRTRLEMVNQVLAEHRAEAEAYSYVQK